MCQRCTLLLRHTCLSTVGTVIDGLLGPPGRKHQAEHVPSGRALEGSLAPPGLGHPLPNPRALAGRAGPGRPDALHFQRPLGGSSQWRASPTGPPRAEGGSELGARPPSGAIGPAGTARSAQLLPPRLPLASASTGRQLRSGMGCAACAPARRRDSQAFPPWPGD